MELENKLRKRIMLEALDYIDDDIISSTVKKITPDDCRTDDPVITWRTPLKHWKRYIALVACLLLLSMAFPLFNYVAVVISNLNAGAGSESTSALSNDAITEVEDEFFWMYTPELEPVTKEQVDECNRAYRLYCCGTLEEFVATYPEENRDQAVKDYWNVTFFTTKRTRRAYLGTFNGAILSAGFLSSMETFEINVGGHTIEFRTGGGISVYYEGGIYSINEAYENGWLTDEDVKTVSERLEKYYNAISGKE